MLVHLLLLVCTLACPLVVPGAKPHATHVTASSVNGGSGAPHAPAAKSRPLDQYQLHASVGEKGTLQSHVLLAQLLTGKPGGKLRRRQQLQEGDAGGQDGAQAAAQQQDRRQKSSEQGSEAAADGHMFTSSSDVGVLHCTFKGLLQTTPHQQHSGSTPNASTATVAARPAGPRNLAEVQVQSRPQLMHPKHPAGHPTQERRAAAAAVDQEQSTGRHAAAAATATVDSGETGDVQADTLHVFVRAVVGNRTGFVHAFAMLESHADQGSKIHLHQHHDVKAWRPQIFVRCPGTGFMQRLHLRTDTMYAPYDVFTLDAKLRSNTSVATARLYDALQQRYGPGALPRLPSVSRWQVEDLEVHLEGWDGACRLAPAVTLLQVEPPDELDAALELLERGERQRVKERVLELERLRSRSAARERASGGEVTIQLVRAVSRRPAGRASHALQTLERPEPEPEPAEAAAAAVAAPGGKQTAASSPSSRRSYAGVALSGQAGQDQGPGSPGQASAAAASGASDEPEAAAPRRAQASSTPSSASTTSLPPAEAAAGNQAVPACMLISPFFGISPQHFVALLLHHMRWHLQYGVTRYLVYLHNNQQLEQLEASPAVQQLVSSQQLQMVLWDELPSQVDKPYLHQVLIYNHALLSLWTEDVWLLVADLDEFLMAPQPLTLAQLLGSCCNQEQYVAQMYVSRSPAFCTGCAAAAGPPSAQAATQGVNASCHGAAAGLPAPLDLARAGLQCSLEASSTAAAAAAGWDALSTEAQLWLLGSAPHNTSAGLSAAHAHPLLLYSFAVHQHNLSHHGKSIVRPPFMRTYRVHYGIPLPAPKHTQRSRTCPLSHALWAHAISQTHPRRFTPDGSDDAVAPEQLTLLDVRTAPHWFWPLLPRSARCVPGLSSC